MLLLLSLVFSSLLLLEVLLLEEEEEDAFLGRFADDFLDVILVSCLSRLSLSLLSSLSDELSPVSPPLLLVSVRGYVPRAMVSGRLLRALFISLYVYMGGVGLVS